MSEVRNITSAKSILTAFDEATIYAALDMISDRIHNAIVISEGTGKADNKLYFWDGKRLTPSMSNGLELDILKGINILAGSFEEDLAKIPNDNKDNEETIKCLKNKVKALRTYIATTKRRSLETTIRITKMVKCKLDEDKTKVNLQDGVYDLLKAEPIPHDVTQMYTKIMPFALSPQEAAPMFTAHLEYVLPDPDTREYFLEMIASSLLRSRREEKIFFLHGKTAENGKSELMRMIITAFGEYATWLDAQTFTSKRAGNATQPEMQMALGMALAVVDEPSKDSMDSSTFKNMANFADIVMRGLYQASKAERWTATCVMLCNTLPPLDAKDAGAARRPVVIPFSRKITQEMKKNDKRPVEYATMKYGEYVGTVEAAGIFNILMEALKNYVNRGCLLPEYSGEMKEATSEYIYRNNSVAKFVNEKCVVGDYAIKATDLYDAYKVFCRLDLEHDENHTMKPANFREAMESLGYAYKTGQSHGAWSRVLLHRRQQAGK